VTEQIEKPAEDRILFIDLETTGLYAEQDVPLEIAVTLTDKLGAHIASYQTLIWEDAPIFTGPVSRIRKVEADFVNKMHTESGLWKDLDEGAREVLTRWDAEITILAFLRTHGVEEKTLPIAGLSIGSLDRPFLQTHLPILNGFLSHRNIDISSIREIAKRVAPELQASMEKALDEKVSKIAVTHRAADDCLYAIELYQAYIANFFYTEAW
jgi:oligoribonuclease